MSKIYTSKDDLWQMCVDNRLQGWQVEVSFWNGSDFDLKTHAYIIADSLFEATFGALADANFDENSIEWQLAEWGIFMPDEDED